MDADAVTRSIDTMADTSGEHALRGIFLDVNRAKADSGPLWVQPDPRTYFHILDGLDCMMPQVAQPILAQLVDARLRVRGGPLTVVELGCGYGVNGALLKYGFSFDLLRERYASPALQRLESAALLAADRHFSASWSARPDVRVVGIDSSPNAVAYAESCGYIDRGLAADLDAGPLTAEAAAALANADLIVSTGTFGRVGKRALDKLVRNAASVPWVACFVPRSLSYQQIARTLRRDGLVTERLEGATFAQRRFRDEREMTATIQALEAHGMNATSKESQGWLHTELFVSRPWTDIEADPIARLISLPENALRRDGPRVTVRPRFPARRATWSRATPLPQ